MVKNKSKRLKNSIDKSKRLNYYKTKVNAFITERKEKKMRIDRVKLVSELTKQDMTQKRLAELAGVSRASVNYIKSGKSCSDVVGNKIAAALKVPIEELLEN